MPSFNFHSEYAWLNGLSYTAIVFTKNEDKKHLISPPLFVDFGYSACHIVQTTI